MQGALFVFFILLCVTLGYNKDLGCRKKEISVCGCPPERTCHNRNVAYDCSVKPYLCSRRCVCKEGFIRNRVNECTSDEICDSCTGPNEFWDCGPECDNECKTYKYQNRTNCPIKNIICNEKCYCADGYARNADGVCVAVESCSACKRGIDGRTCKCGPRRSRGTHTAEVFYVAYPDCSATAATRRAEA